MGKKELKHYGILRKSGRYPWGSGEDPYQRSGDFFAYVNNLKAQGLTEADIARGVGLTLPDGRFSTTELRATASIAKNVKRRADEAQALRLKDKGLSNVAIGERMGINESSVRALLDPARQARADVLTATVNKIRDEVAEKKYLDVGLGTENWMGISKEKLATAVAVLKDEGYKDFHVQVEQVGMPGKYTDVKVLVPPGTTYQELFQNRDKIQTIQGYTNDRGRTFEPIVRPQSISSSRVAVRYGPDGGAKMDGVIELRPGVADIALNENKRYAQVRIAVDDTHYLKGMAMYGNDLPKGVDIRFNTNKSDSGNMLDALKPIKKTADGGMDEENPFGAIVRQKYYNDEKGNKKLSVLNIVGSPTKEGSGEEGAWGEWSKSLSSQMLSKQSESLAKKQLDLAYGVKKSDFDEIMSLTNPAVKRRLLDSFADDCDSASVKLKGYKMPRQGTHVILPIKDMKDNEIYAPQYRQGESVVLIRHPHGGTFEIPELKVNNRHPTARALLGDATDAVGINSNVAARLSGADFDGDSVIVIPNNSKLIKTSAPLKGLKDWDPITAYPAYHGMKTIDGGVYNSETKKVEYNGRLPQGKTKQREMGDVSNLITDMTIKGASPSEVARAVRHSMVIIDSEKHVLNYKQSYQDNNIPQLKAKYQKKENGKSGGASTLISKANSDVRVPDRKLRKASEGGSVDPVTGEKIYTYTGESYTTTKINKRTGQVIEKNIPRTIRSTKMAETKDAYSLSSGTAMEAVYANHANNLKALANQSRLEALKTPSSKYSPSANKAYQDEVKSLNAKLNIALRNKPLERQAQLIARAEVTAKKKANPELEASDIKKINSMAITKARARVGASKQRVDITPKEWEAIQAGAISNNKLVEILKNTDMDLVKQYATPRAKITVPAAKVSMAKVMAANGYTQAEIADRLGISVSTLGKALKE